jgi:hypothetical protein
VEPAVARLVNCRMILRTVCKDHVPGKLDPALLKALAHGRRWFEEMAWPRIVSASARRSRGVKVSRRATSRG